MKIEEIVTRFEDDISWLEQGCNTELEIVEHIKEAIDKLKELKWWRSLEKNCGTCKHCDKDEQEEPCVKCFDPDDPHDVDYYWECGYEGTTKQEDVSDINDGDMINCTDCIKHGGDWECDRTHCHKGTKQQATKALEPCEDVVSRRRLLSDLKELIAAWEKYPVMAEQIKGVEAAIGYVEAIPFAKPNSKELSSTHKALDAISRQAAIDALDRIFDRCEEIEAHLPEDDPDRTGYKMYPDYTTVWKYLHQLPSAQPEIVRCGDCKWWGRKDTYKDGSSIIVCKKGWSTSPEGYCHHAERGKYK